MFSISERAATANKEAGRADSIPDSSDGNRSLARNNPDNYREFRETDRGKTG